MVIMNEDKDSAGPKTDTPKNTCPRAARENARKTEVYVKKPAHTGLKFHFDKKKLITHEFAFNSVSKTEKVTRCRHLDKSLDRQNNSESSNCTDSKKIEVLMDTLKISRSEEHSSREKSPLRKEVPKSPVVERLTSKKACTRCSRCSKTPKEEKPEMKPLKNAKDKDSSLKITKKENHSTKTVKLTPQFMKPTESSIKHKFVEPQEKALKPKSILIQSEKSALHDDKNDASKNCETPQPPKPIASKKKCSKLAKLLAEPQEKNLNAKYSVEYSEMSVSRHCEKILSNSEKPTAEKSHCTNEKKVEFTFWPTSGAPESMTVVSSGTFSPDPNDKGKTEIVNGMEHPAESDTIACHLNGRHDEHLCDPHHGLESPSGTKASKIPRKTAGAVGLKAEASLTKDIMSQQLIEL